MIFYLGTHKPIWLERTAVPLFISRRAFLMKDGVRLRDRMPVALAPWALDSGGFTEIANVGSWDRVPLRRYVEDVRRIRDEVGHLAWVAPQDWMVEPSMVAKTGLDVAEHQRRTVENFLRLRDELGDLVIPVVQGWTLPDYLRCVALYADAGVELRDFATVGIGSICRRGQDSEISAIVRALVAGGIRAHGFGVRGRALAMLVGDLFSADSLAWSARARRADPLPECHHPRCNNCLRFALRWREALLGRAFDPGDPDQLRLEATA